MAVSSSLIYMITALSVVILYLGFASYWAYDGVRRNNLQDRQLPLVANNLNNEILAVNASIIGLVESAIASLGTLLNDVKPGINTFVTRDPSGTFVTVDAFTINGITASNASKRINVLGGTGIGIVTGATDLTVSTSAILSLSGVFPANTTGDVNLIGTGMIDVVPFANSSTVQVDGSMIVTALTTLQNMDLMQEAQIMNISSIVSSLQTQVNSVQMAGDMVAQALNGTVITFNMTLVELIVEVMQAQAAIATLQAQLANFTTTAVPTGSVFAWGGSAMGPYPAGYLLCDGSSHSVASCPDLFGVIANMYGGSMGSFNVPDLRGKVVAGVNTVGNFNVVVGSAVGTETHTLTTAQMPAHSHTGSTGGTAVPHTHLTNVNMAASTANSPVCPFDNTLSNNNCGANGGTIATHFVTDQVSDTTHVHGINPEGSSNAHPNIQPTLVMQYIIKT